MYMYTTVKWKKRRALRQRILYKNNKYCSFPFRVRRSLTIAYNSRRAINTRDLTTTRCNYYYCCLKSTREEQVELGI